jgi:hypothetical protein
LFVDAHFRVDLLDVNRERAFGSPSSLSFGGNEASRIAPRFISSKKRLFESMVSTDESREPRWFREWRSDVRKAPFRIAKGALELVSVTSWFDRMTFRFVRAPSCFESAPLAPKVALGQSRTTPSQSSGRRSVLRERRFIFEPSLSDAQSVIPKTQWRLRNRVQIECSGVNSSDTGYFREFSWEA